jgi:hypothetical protein
MPGGSGEREPVRVPVNSQFRLWLRAYIEQEQVSRGYRELMRGLDYARPGRRFTRDEFNAR